MATPYAAEFRDFYAEVLAAIVDHFRSELRMPPELVPRLETLLEHCLNNGKLLRGNAVVETATACWRRKSSASSASSDSACGNDLSAATANKIMLENEMPLQLRRQACAAGWAIEWFQAGMLVADDIMDQSLTRRGRKCWYRVDGVGLSAVNDALILESHAYLIIDKYFSDTPYYSQIVKLFHQVVYLTECGQMIDLTSSLSALTEKPKSNGPASPIAKNTHGASEASNSVNDASNSATGKQEQNLEIEKETKKLATPELEDRKCAADADSVSHLLNYARQQALATYKTAYYTVYLPIALGMVVAGVFTKEAGQEALAIALPIGEFFQNQDDYLDIFGDPAVLGKQGTDIAEGKCTWFIVKALELASPEQRATLLHYYGNAKGPEDVAIVRNIMDTLGLQQIYSRYETEFAERIEKDIKSINPNHRVPPEVYRQLFYRFYRRQK